MKVGLTGNPFADTGLATIATIAECHDIDDLTLEDMKKVHGDGTRLARLSSTLKNTSMIFTTNYLAVPAKEKDVEKKVRYYSTITTAILNSIGNEKICERCESCGNNKSLDLNELLRKTLEPLGDRSLEKRHTGRNWFPLAGSLGSDAQSLPAASRAPNICAKCLFAVHYLPLGTFLVDGRLIVFQSTSRSFWYGLVKSIVNEIEERVSAGKNDTLGAKEGSIVAVRKLLDYMDEMKQEKLDPGVSLFMWKFSNAGTGADLSVEEIPNPALFFLKKCVEHGLKSEVTGLVAKEKGSDTLLRCILAGRDYHYLYPYKKSLGVSPDLFQLYQTNVRKVPLARLRVASAIADYVKTRLNAKDIEKLGKDTEKDIAKQNNLRKHVVEMVANGKLTSLEYLSLFSKLGLTTSVDYDAWKFIRYYLHNKPKFEDDGSQNPILLDELSLFIAAAIYTTIVQERGLERFKQTVLERLKHEKIDPLWLKKQFTKNAAIQPSFTYATWKKLCVNDKGRESPYEFMFRLRLVWTEWAAKGVITPAPRNPFETPFQTSGLPEEYERMLESIMDKFVSKRNLEKFKSIILDKLQSGEKGLGWFIEKFSELGSISPEALEQFYLDEQGIPIKYTRLFQMHLFLANRYREQIFKQPKVIVSP